MCCLLYLSYCIGDRITPEEPNTDKNQIPFRKPRTIADGEALSFTTTTDKSKLFKSDTIPFTTTPSGVPIIEIDVNTRYQSVEGFGAAITGSTCFNLLQMDSFDRHQFLTEVFDPETGLGYSYIRISIGGSDFSLGEFTHCDKKGIENFAIHELDRRDLFPILHEILGISPKLKIIAAPWSCPKWMKIGLVTPLPHDKWTSGRLAPKYYKDYAEYFVKWIKSMEKEGFHIDAVTPQNEPLNIGNSMSTRFTWKAERDFIKVLGPKFQENGIKTQIYVFDHNYNYDMNPGESQYPLKIYEDAEAAKYIEGSAWHNYGGSVEELDTIHGTRPDKSIFFTEASIGTWNYNWARCLITDFKLIFLGTLNRFGKGVTLWNLMLDENGAPNRPNGCTTCFGAVEISSKNFSLSSIKRNSHFYDIGHCSLVIQPGAVRVQSTGTNAIQYAAFQNPDKSFGFIAVNDKNKTQKFGIKAAGDYFEFAIPATGIISIKWKATKELPKFAAEIREEAPIVQKPATNYLPIIGIVCGAAIISVIVVIAMKKRGNVEQDSVLLQNTIESFTQ